MNGLILRDWIVLYRKHLRRLVILLPVLSLVFGLVLRLMFCSVFSIVLPMFIGAFVMNLFSEDEKNDWFKYVKTLPVTKRQLVAARYGVCIGTVSVCTLFALALNCVVYLLFRDYALGSYLVFSGTGFFAAMLMCFIMLPVCFRVGASGTNIVGISMSFLVSGLTLLLQKLDIPKIYEAVLQIPVYKIVLSFIAVLTIAGIVSFLLSVRFRSFAER